MQTGETVACTYADFSAHFGFLLLAGISYTKEIKEIEMDMRAARRLNQLYVTLLSDNPDWGTADRRPDMNHSSWLGSIFCFFAEDTGIFAKGLFTTTLQQMSASDWSITHEIIGEIFRAMNIPTTHEGQVDDRYRRAASIRSWANAFPYVNGGLFCRILMCRVSAGSRGPICSISAASTGGKSTRIFSGR